MITVAIDARLRPGQVDGVARFAKGLARAYTRVPAQRLRIVWIAGGDAAWLEGCLRPGDAVISDPVLPAGSDDLWVRAGDDRTAQLALLRSVEHRTQDPRLPRSPAELAAFDVDVVHFLSQDAFVTELPSIYHPHDLQHAAFPQFFDTATIGWRELAWRAYAGQAAAVCVAAPHVRDAVAGHWPETADAMRIISLGPLALHDATPSWAPRDEVPLPDVDPDVPVLLYPAGPWPHKNHVRLVEAFVRAVGPQRRARLVLTGFDVDPAGDIAAAIRLLAAGDLIRCLGRVPDAVLARLYEHAVGVVLPSVHEAGSFPLVEAHRAGIRIAASDIPGHRTRGHAVDAWFDPFDVDAMAAAIARILDAPPSGGAPPASEASGPPVGEAFIDLYEQVARR